MEKFLTELDDEKTLLKIQHECTPDPPRKSRLDSNTVWDALEKHFSLYGDGTKNELKRDQGCSSDTTCFQMEVIKRRKKFPKNNGEEMLKSVQRIAAAMHLPPYNSLKDWFVPITKAAIKQWGKGHKYTKLFSKYMKSPEGNQLIQRKQANEKVIQRNKKGINVHYEYARKQVLNWGGSNDWRDNFNCVVACIGCRKTALLDSRIKFVKAEQPGHDDRYWVRQVGVLKDRSAENVEEKNAEYIPGKTVEKPITFGFTYAQIQAMIKRIRSNIDVKGLTRAQMGNKYGSNMVKKIKAAFPGQNKQDPRLGVHFLRALYANVAYHFFKDEIGNSLTSFISTVLAHNSNSLNTALSYQTLNIQWALPDNISASTKKTVQDLREIVSILRNDLQVKDKQINDLLERVGKIEKQNIKNSNDLAENDPQNEPIIITT